MTTIIGIRTNAGLDSIVLASDYQVTGYDGRDKPISRGYDKKIWHGEYWALGNDGLDCGEVHQFFRVLMGHKRYDSSPEIANEIFQRALKEKDFVEIRTLNRGLRKKDYRLEDLPSFIFAVNKPELSLWWIDEFGNLHERDEDKNFDYICAGSGEEMAEKYIQDLIDERKIDREKITTKIAIKIVRGTIRSAEKEDLTTGLGYDLVIVTAEKGIKSWGEEIKKEIREAEEKKLDAIGDEYEPQEKKDENNT